MKRALLSIAFALSFGLAGCAGDPAPPAESPKGAEPSNDEGSGRHKAGPSVESEVGAMDALKTKEVFAGAAGKLGACHTKGTKRVPYLAGFAHFEVRVAKDGSVRWAYVKDSSLGDRETESCMLSVLKGLSWPKPEGGEGRAENRFDFDASDEERPPVAWSTENLGAAQGKAKEALSACKKSAGTKGLKVTFYVDDHGKAEAVGVSSRDEKGEAAVGCVVDAIKGLKFPSPGSYAAKVSLSVD